MYTCECGKTYENYQAMNGHYSHCNVHRKAIGKKELKDGSRTSQLNGNRSWNKGLTKEDHDGLASMAEKKSQKIGEETSFYGRSHSSKTKEKMSEARIEYLNSDKSHLKWFEISNGNKNIKVQGTWEKETAETLNKHNINWDRVSLSYLGHRTYTPDFYLPDKDIYIEVKGFMYEKDKYKMWKVKEEHDITIKLIEDLSTLKEFDLNKLESFADAYPKETIDQTKFINHWK